MTQAPLPTSVKPARLFNGITLVLIGSASYGLLSTMVKLAYREGFTTAEVTLSQFAWGALVLTVMALVQSKTQTRASRSDKVRLMLAGTTTGFTSVFYYISVTDIPASIAVVLLMQSIWLGVVFESVQTRTRPSFDKIAAVILVLGGTLLATNTLGRGSAQLNSRGIVFGLLSAISYTCTLIATGRVATHLSAIKRSQFMLYGGLLVAVSFAALTQLGPHHFGVSWLGPDLTRDRAFDFGIVGTYGLLVAVFGTILPPIMLNKGFPVVGIGLGSIISSVELPFATLVAFLLLGERIGVPQMIGIGIILGAVFVLNYRLLAKAR